MVVVRDEVGELVKFTEGCCVVVVGCTDVLFEWSVDKRDYSEEGDGDS